MHPLQAPLLIVLLLIPNTSWHDWRAAQSAPHLAWLLRHGAVAAMSARTAEPDTITPVGGIRTIIAGARLGQPSADRSLDYPFAADNLTAALASAGVRTQTLDPQSSRLLRAPPVGMTDRGRFVVEILPSDPSRSDAEIGRWTTTLGHTHGALIVASPNPSRAEYAAFDQLLPIVVWTPGAAQSGLLYSPSTRTPGLITTTDLAPTIARLAGASLPGPVYGTASTITNPIEAPSTDPSSIPARIAEAAQAQARAQVAVPFVAVGLALLVVLAHVLAVAGPKTRAARRLIFAALEILVFLISFGPGMAAGAVLWLSSVAVAWTVGAKRSFAAAAACASGAVVALLLADAALFHCRFTAFSLLSYNALEGSRYYGVGNESMGVLIGATVVVSEALARRKGGVALGAALWLAAAAALGAPEIGAKAGGLLVALLGLAAFLITRLRMARKRRVSASLVTAAVVVAAGIGALALLGRTGASHVTDTLAQARQHGAGIVWSVIHRKAAMDVHLVFHSAWMLVLVACLASAALRLRGEPALGRRRDTKSLIVTGGAAVLACLALNDAGVVAAALCAVFAWSGLLSLAAREEPAPNADATGVSAALGRGEALAVRA